MNFSKCLAKMLKIFSIKVDVRLIVHLCFRVKSNVQDWQHFTLVN